MYRIILSACERIPEVLLLFILDNFKEVIQEAIWIYVECHIFMCHHHDFLKMAHTAYTSARCMCVLHSSLYNLQDGSIFRPEKEGKYAS